MRERQQTEHAHVRGQNGSDGALYLRGSPVEAECAPNILSLLSNEEYRLVLEHANSRIYSPGEEVFGQGKRHKGIFLIESGTVRTFYISPAGRAITLAYWTRGNFVGGPEVFGGGEHIWSAEAHQESKILFLEGTSLKTLVKSLPNLALGIIDGLVHKGRCYSELLQILGTRSVKNRLAHLLVTLAFQYGIWTEEGIIIQRPYTHDEFANMIGSTRQWVTKMLDIYVQQGFIEKRDGNIVVRDLKSLETSIV